MNVFIRKGSRPGDPDNGMFVTTVFSVIILSLAAAVLDDVGNAPVWNAAGVLWFVAAGLLASLMGRAALFAGIGYIGSSRAAAIKNAAPMITVGVAIIFLGERLSPLGTAGIGMTFLGLFLLCLEAFQLHRADRRQSNGEGYVEDESVSNHVDGGDAVENQEPSKAPSIVVVGTLSGILAATFFGLGQAARKVGIDYMPDALLGATIASWTAFIAYLVVSIARGRLRVVIRSGFGEFHPYLLLAGLALAVGQLGFFAAITYAPVSYVSTVAASETLLTVFLASIFVGRSEGITPRVVVAATAVFAGATVIALS